MASKPVLLFAGWCPRNSLPEFGRNLCRRLIIVVIYHETCHCGTEFVNKFKVARRVNVNLVVIDAWQRILYTILYVLVYAIWKLNGLFIILGFCIITCIRNFCYLFSDDFLGRWIQVYAPEVLNVHVNESQKNLTFFTKISFPSSGNFWERKCDFSKYFFKFQFILFNCG